MPLLSCTSRTLRCKTLTWKGAWSTTCVWILKVMSPILLIYAQLGSPGIDFHSFWDVYNQLCDTVDADLLARTSIGTFTRHGESMLEDEVVQLPLSDLQPCVFGENGVPAGQLGDDGSGSGRPPLHRSFYADSWLVVYPEVDFQVTYTDDEGDEIYWILFPLVIITTWVTRPLSLSPLSVCRHLSSPGPVSLKKEGIESISALHAFAPTYHIFSWYCLPTLLPQGSVRCMHTPGLECPTWLMIQNRGRASCLSRTSDCGCACYYVSHTCIWPSSPGFFQALNSDCPSPPSPHPARVLQLQVLHSFRPSHTFPPGLQVRQPPLHPIMVPESLGCTPCPSDSSLNSCRDLLSSTQFLLPLSLHTFSDSWESSFLAPRKGSCTIA